MRKKVQNALFLSGDRHYAEISRLESKEGHALFEVTASGLNNPTMETWRNDLRYGKALFAKNFSTIYFDWQNVKPSLRIELNDENGAAFETLELVLEGRHLKELSKGNRRGNT